MEKIVGARKGAVAMASAETIAHLDHLKAALALAKIGALRVIIAQDRAGSIVVSLKYHVEFNEEVQPTQRLFLSKNGAWDPEEPSQQHIDITKDARTKAFCSELAAKIHKTTDITNYGYTKEGDPIVPEDVIIRQMREVLKPQIKMANDRLVVEVKNIVQDPMIMAEARRAYEDVVRDKVHRALEGYESVEPEAMHRFIDELYCKKIHES